MDLLSPASERNENSDKENENENMCCVKNTRKENNKEKNSLEEDNRPKRNMEEQNMMEFHAKRGKLDSESYSNQDHNHLKSDEGSDGDIASDADIVEMIERIGESREKYPLPNFFINHTGSTRGNIMLRFDDIGPISRTIDVLLLIPRGIHEFVVFFVVYPSGSKHHAFVSFDCYEIALSFLKKFNNLAVPETRFTYNISWAPLKLDELDDECEQKRDDEYDLEYDHIFQNLGDEQIDESKGNEFGVHMENIEKDKQVDEVKALEMKTVECEYDDEHLSEGKQADESKDVLVVNIEKDKQVDDLKALEVKLVECDEHEHDDEHLSGTTEEEHVDESKGNQFDGPGEKFENEKQGDVPKALKVKMPECDEVEKLAAGVEKLFSRLHEEAHSGKDASPWLWGTNKAPKFDPEWDDDGVTKTLYLDMVDPVIGEEDMARVFGRYGKCKVNLPPGKGCGTVTFDDRSAAKSAHEALSTVMRRECICEVCWGIEYEDYFGREIVRHPDPPCYVFGRLCPLYQEGQHSASWG